MFAAIGYALATGMVATVNPCGFALLPAYLAMFMGTDGGASRRQAVGRAIKVSLLLTAGFITVFGVLGILISPVLDIVSELSGFFGIAIGIALVGVGAWLLLGHELRLGVFRFNHGGDDGSARSMYLFGVSYAVASLSCAIVPFVGAAAASEAGGSFGARLAAFVAYGVGMGLVIAVLTVATALARTEIVVHLRKIVPVVNRIAGALMILAGLYIAYYGWYEVRVFILEQDASADPIIGAGLQMQSWLVEHGPTSASVWLWVLGGIGFLFAVVGISQLAGSTRPGVEGSSPVDKPT